MAAVPTFAVDASPATPPAESTLDLSAKVQVRAKASYAAVGGTVTGGFLYYSDRQHLAVYLGAGSPPTRNRGQRGVTRTKRPAGQGARGGLWRF